MKQWNALVGSVLLAAFGVSQLANAAIENDSELRFRVGGFGEAPRDLGASGNGQDTAEAFSEVHGSLHTIWNRGFATKLRLQALYSTGEIFLNTDETPQPSEGFVALREAWIDIASITSFPGEVLRFGIQRLKQDDGLWYDDDAAAANWVMDTTLLQAHFGLAQQLSGFRSDEGGVERDQEDRPYVYGGLGTQFSPGHFLGLRLAYAQDNFDLADEIATPDPDDRERERRFGWGGLYLHNGYYDYKRPSAFSYTAELMALHGTERYTDPAIPGSVRERDVSGTGADIGLRLGSPEVPLRFGVGWAWGSGGRDNGDSQRFEQTGLHSNRSRFTGTRSQVHRFGEALQLNLSNVRVASAYFSVPAQRADFSLIYHGYRRVDDTRPIDSETLNHAATDLEADIGSSVDLVLATYFEGFERVLIRDSGPGGAIRLRASLFTPGDAYPADADSLYRVILEMQWVI